MVKTKRKLKNFFNFYYRHGLRPLAKIIIFFAPYMTLFLHECVNDIRASIIFPIIVFICCSLMLAIANENNVGDDFPLPFKRFTKDDEFQGIAVKKEDVNDMIMYVNDLENWLERKGFIYHEK